MKAPLRSTWPPCWGRWVILAAFVLHQFPLMAVAAVAVASFDPEHELRISYGGEALEIVLHHRETAFQGGHKHGLAAKILTHQEGAPDGDPDHVFHFLCARDGAPAEKEIAIPQPLMSSIPATTAVAEPGFVRFPAPRPLRNAPRACLFPLGTVRLLL